MNGALLVAIVDDDRRVLESLESLLESAGYRVRSFSSAQEFLASDCISTVRCVVSDVLMPEMDGFQLAHELLALRPQLPVVLITSLDLQGQSVRLESNCLGILNKPFKAAKLLLLVGRAVATRSPRP